MVGKNRSCSSVRLPEPGSLPLRTRLLISVTSATVCSRAFSSAKETPQALSTYGVVWQDLSPSRASPIVRRSYPSWRTIRASQPLRLTNSSGSLYSNLFFTDHPLPTALSLLLSMPWTSVTRVHPRPCQNFLGTAFLSSLAASNSVTSRPARVVDNYFRSPSLIHHMSIERLDDKNRRDCGKYINSQVLELKELRRVTADNWLPDLEQKLVTHACGLFVWVSIVMEYLKNKSADPVAALEDLLDPDASRDDMPAEEKLDVLYSAILSKCNWKDKMFKHDYPIVMVAIVTAKSSLSVTAS